jgi:hypothetical protein
MIKYKTDEWVLYCAYPDNDILKDNIIEAVVLEVLTDDLLYAYRIYLNDGSSKYIKVKEENLLKHNRKQ